VIDEANLDGTRFGIRRELSAAVERAFETTPVIDSLPFID